MNYLILFSAEEYLSTSFSRGNGYEREILVVSKRETADKALRFFSISLALVATIATILSSFSNTLNPDLVNTGTILEGLVVLMSILTDCLLKLRMIRFILDNRSILENIVNDESTTLNRVEGIKRFKRRLVFQFVLLAVLDVCIGLAEVVACLIIDPSSPLYYLFQVLAVPFYLPLHIILLTTLLDFFKDGVLGHTGILKLVAKPLSTLTAAREEGSAQSTDNK